MASLIVPQGAEVFGRASDIGVELAQVSFGAARFKGVSPVHWRSMARVGGYLLGISAYRPDGNRPGTEPGREAILSMISKSRAATEASRSTAVTRNLTTAPSLGLFD